MANLSRKHKSTLYLLIKKGWGTWGGGGVLYALFNNFPGQI